jgi:SRSO17 transposase
MCDPRFSTIVSYHVAKFSLAVGKANALSIENLLADAAIEPLAATIKARWLRQQAHQQLKEGLGLDHFEGRSWAGYNDMR